MIYFDESFFNILTFFSSMLEWTACIMFINSFLKKKTSKLKFNLMISALITLVCTVKVFNYIIAGEFEIHQHQTFFIRVLCKIVVVLLSCLFIKAVYLININHMLCIIIPILLLCTSNVLHLLVEFFAKIVISHYRWLFALILMTIIDFIFVSGLYFASKSLNKKELIYYKKDIFFILISFSASLLILSFFNVLLLRINQVFFQEMLLIVLCVVVVLVMDIIVLQLLLRTAYHNRKLKENEIKLMGESLKNQYAKNIKEQDELFRRMRHDFKHHMCVVDALLDKNKIEEAKSYIKDYIGSTTAITYVDTENEYLNAILNSKITYAKKNDINITTVIAGEIDGINNIDMCNLMGNLIDNAVEGCASTKEKDIVVKILSEEAFIRISVANTISSSVLKGNANLNTSKKDAENHGFGTKSIKNIASKYNGYADYYEEGNKFFANITLVKN